MLIGATRVMISAPPGNSFGHSEWCSSARGWTRLIHRGRRRWGKRTHSVSHMRASQAGPKIPRRGGICAAWERGQKGRATPLGCSNRRAPVLRKAIPPGYWDLRRGLDLSGLCAIAGVGFGRFSEEGITPPPPRAPVHKSTGARGGTQPEPGRSASGANARDVTLASAGSSPAARPWRRACPT